MCGICGYFGFERDERLLRRMAGVIRHRGPDDEGFLVSERVGLGMSRLSIIDVVGGHQPIYNEDESLAIVFNGEIYNYRTLAADLERAGHRFRTHTDTETILHLYEDLGQACLGHLRGMFAFAIADLRRQRLFIARDRLGIKPLYYWWHGGRLLFGSELKCILECEAVPHELNLAAVDAYLSLRYVPGPEALLRGILKLPAAHWLAVENGNLNLARYWEPCFCEGPYRSDAEYEEEFDQLFMETVKVHLESDVPLGAYLSGGLDSSAIVAAMSRLTNRPVKTFSVGFDWQDDELPAARETARRLGCDHHEVVCHPEDMALLPKIVWALDEPIGDAIVLPMYLLSRAAREHVKVILTGEGADEILAGYLFHKVMYWAHRYAQWVPRVVQSGMVRSVMSRMPAGVMNAAFDYPAALGERGRLKVLDYLALLGRRPLAEEYRFLISLFDSRDKQDLYNARMRDAVPPAVAASPERPVKLNDILGLQFGDWLPDDILMKADKTNMANSVEGRVPFMDHELVEFMGRAPPRLKLNGFQNKILLRRYLKRSASPQSAGRRKKAFYIPLDRYLRTPGFRAMAEDCLSEESVRRRGLFRWPTVRRLWKQARSDDFLYGKQILSLVILEIWQRIYLDGARSAEVGP